MSVSNLSLFEEYVQFHNIGVSRFGPRTTVLMEVGSFFELYAAYEQPTSSVSQIVSSTSATTWGELATTEKLIGADIYKICDLFNIQVTKKNKNIPEISKSNHLMAGFPSHSSKRFIDILLRNNYTVILVEQVTPPPRSVREITEVLSPSTNVDLDQVTHYEANEMMIVYLERMIHSRSKQIIYSVGWSTFDASTGHSKIGEINGISDEKLLYDELNRLIITNNPVELVLTSRRRDQDPTNAFSSQILDKIGGIKSSTQYLLNRLNEMDPKFTCLTFQNELLRRVYPDTGLLSVIEFLDLEYKPYALCSFVYLLQFVFEHSESLLHRIKKPVCEDNDHTRLTLASNCLHQLNVLSQSTDVSLLTILNNASTSVGKRFFKDALCNPICDPIEIEKRYKNTAVFIENELFMICRKGLKNVRDIERLIRKVQRIKICPNEFVDLLRSFELIFQTFHTLMNQKHDLLEEIASTQDRTMYYQVMKTYETFKNQIKEDLLVDEMSKYNMEIISDTNIFVHEKYPEVDHLCHTLQKFVKEFETFIEVNNRTREYENWIKLEFNDKDGYHFVMTATRFNKMHRDLQELFGLRTVLSRSGSTIKLSNEKFINLNSYIRDTKNQIKELNQQNYTEYMKRILERFSISLFDPSVRLLQWLDFHATCAYNATRFSLTRPCIRNDIDHPNAEGPSFVRLHEVRHLIVEHVSQETQYTPNSISLGASNTPENHQDSPVNGLILFGVNSSGKSSFMKSVGIAIILAQSGMYVPAQKMVFRPYQHVFTRIQTNDDILRGLSTFSKEILELRNIFKKATQNSLIIGDELCSGTESQSAIAIVVAGIITLSTIDSSFIFATHLHELTKINAIKELTLCKKISVKHLSVQYDEGSKTLVYDRVLREGSGSSLYGLEVCKAMDMDRGFLHLASKIRQEIIHGSINMVENHRSRYNSKVIMDHCAVCNTKGNPYENKLECHHIRFQKDADKQGIIDKSFHKNARFNLVPLCEKCHDRVHSNQVSLIGWKTTSNGRQLKVQVNENDQSSST
jgi:DNA mismatch repair protein MutS